MKSKELRSLQKVELESKLVELRKELMKDNAQIALGSTPENPGKVGSVKRNIARIITLINEQQRGKQLAPAAQPQQEKKGTSTEASSGRSAT